MSMWELYFPIPSHFTRSTGASKGFSSRYKVLGHVTFLTPSTVGQKKTKTLSTSSRGFVAVCLQLNYPMPLSFTFLNHLDTHFHRNF